MDSLKSKNIIIGVTGSIACYKVLDIIKKLRDQGANVHVIMTHSAVQLVDKKEFEKASNNMVRTEVFEPNVDYKSYLRKDEPIKHISLADIADLFLVCPATANVIAKLAHGIADDLLTTSILATSATVLICPAMNVKMWKHPITQKNVKTLKECRYEFVDPEKGMLACGYEGIGRLANPLKITQRISAIVQRRNNLTGKKIVVSAGATSEEIDPIRVITNKSSGKMGTYIAEEAFLRGAQVTLIRGANSVTPQYHLKEISISSVSDLFKAMKDQIKDADVVIHSAAVSDFTTAKNEGKIKSTNKLHLELQPTTKIFEKLKGLNKNIMLIGFKAEYQVSEKELIARAYDLLQSANADYVVANDVGKKERGFDVETNEVFIVDKKGKSNHIELADKRFIANKILDLIR